MFCNMKAYWTRVLFFTAHGHEHQRGILMAQGRTACLFMPPHKDVRHALRYAIISARHTRYACSSIRRTACLFKPPHKGALACTAAYDQHGILDTRALLSGAPRAPLSRSQGSFWRALRHAHQHGILIRVPFSAAHCAPLYAAHKEVRHALRHAHQHGMLLMELDPKWGCS
jgi:hypothetical protein